MESIAHLRIAALVDPPQAPEPVPGRAAFQLVPGPVLVPLRPARSVLVASIAVYHRATGELHCAVAEHLRRPCAAVRSPRALSATSSPPQVGCAVVQHLHRSGAETLKNPEFNFQVSIDAYSVAGDLGWYALTGQVIDATSGNPIPDAQVDFSHFSYNRSGPRKDATRVLSYKEDGWGTGKQYTTGLVLAMAENIRVSPGGRTFA